MDLLRTGGGNWRRPPRLDGASDAAAPWRGSPRLPPGGAARANGASCRGRRASPDAGLDVGLGGDAGVGRGRVTCARADATVHRWGRQRAGRPRQPRPRTGRLRRGAAARVLRLDGLLFVGGERPRRRRRVRRAHGRIGAQPVPVLGAVTAGLDGDGEAEAVLRRAGWAVEGRRGGEQGAAGEEAGGMARGGSGV